MTALDPANCLHIHHIGSTSVPGLDAKSIIDMIPVVRDILSVDSPTTLDAMSKLGYIAKGENGLPFRRFFFKDDPTDGTIRLFHLHVYQEGNPEIEQHLAYRDYLREKPEVAKKYADLKKSLAQKYPDNMTEYCCEKSKFVTEIGKDIKFEGVLLRDCFTEFEWNEFKRLLNLEESNFSVEENNHYFVCYKGISKIIGAVQLDNGFEMRKFSMEDKHLEDEFLRLINLWKEHKKVMKS